MDAIARSRSTSIVEVKVVGKHIYGNLYGCNEGILKDIEKLKNITVEAIKVGNMTLLDVKAWKIGDGVSVLAVILESHIAIHTWPEYRFATVDVYSCGTQSDPEAAFDYIVKKLEAKNVIRGFADRSYDQV